MTASDSTENHEQANEVAYPVKLYVYDLSGGSAMLLSQQMIGIPIEAVYHTSIVVHGKEYFFSRGIAFSKPGESVHGIPMEVVDLGTTYVSTEIFEEYLVDLRSEYHDFSYDLFQHNCNHFSNEVSEFLTGNQIPEKIRTLPQRVLSTPAGQALAQMLSQQLTNFATAVGPNDHEIR